jgi:hypothetical protein
MRTTIQLRSTLPLHTLPTITTTFITVAYEANHFYYVQYITGVLGQPLLLRSTTWLLGQPFLLRSIFYRGVLHVGQPYNDSILH